MKKKNKKKESDRKGKEKSKERGKQDGEWPIDVWRGKKNTKSRKATSFFFMLSTIHTIKTKISVPQTTSIFNNILKKQLSGLDA